MDYQAFYNEVVAWINQVNQMATKYGMHSTDFWTWASRSIGEMCEKYNNNPLVVKQLAMLYEWLDEVYITTVKGGITMPEKLSRMDRDQIIFQLLVHTIYTEEALNKLSDKQLIEMYKVKVEEA